MSLRLLNRLNNPATINRPTPANMMTITVSKPLAARQSRLPPPPLPPLLAARLFFADAGVSGQAARRSASLGVAGCCVRKGLLSDMVYGLGGTRKRGIIKSESGVGNRGGLTVEGVIFGVRHHLDGTGNTVRHIEKAGDVSNVKDLFINKSGIAQGLSVGFTHL